MEGEAETGFESLDDPLRPAVCVRCGYDLTGLPAVGACPECGRPYDEPEVCLHGFAAGHSASAWNRRPQSRRRYAWQWAWSVAIFGFFAWVWSGTRGRIFLPYGWILIVGTSLIGSTWRRFNGSAAVTTTLLLRITPDGVNQLLRGSGPIPYDKVDGRQPIPWRKLQRIAIGPERDGLVRITMGNDPAWWKPRVDRIDAVVRCTPDALAALRQRIAKWRAQADRR